ncbi:MULTISPECIES: hypothetical protein [Vibrio]|uniref:hypothetical protein n=1 Tax=Vibrio TaxID=662 RepID=UPI000933DB78|nr:MULTISPECIES: hypothetical protein [Vibrio]MDV2395556.1 hypothetical protein [Vibrio cholerae]PXA73471.1 hypothetical protein DMC15_05285 [Vibrio sp. 11986-1-5]
MTMINPYISTSTNSELVDKEKLSLLKNDTPQFFSEDTKENLFKTLFSSNTKDALLLIDQILSQYTSNQTIKADRMAKDIENKAKAIAEINRLWGLIMQDNLPHTNPTDNDKKTPLGDSVSGKYLDEINKIISSSLSDKQGIAAITGKDLENSKKHNVNYNELQAMNATMTAYCDTIQVDLDSHQQLFKNIMTELSSTQEEIRDVRRSIVAIAKG